MEKEMHMKIMIKKVEKYEKRSNKVSLTESEKREIVNMLTNDDLTYEQYDIADILKYGFVGYDNLANGELVLAYQERFADEDSWYITSLKGGDKIG